MRTIINAVNRLTLLTGCDMAAASYPTPVSSTSSIPEQLEIEHFSR
jgi:hypothetical protein